MNPFTSLFNTLSSMWTFVKETHKENTIIIALVRFLLIFLFVSFILYLILKGEKPGMLVFKNYYYIFFLAILPSIILGFYHNFFHFYLEENLNKYIEEKMNSKTLKQLGLSPEEANQDSLYNKLQNMINVKSIIITTLSLAVSYYFSNFLKIIIDKGVIQDVLKMKKKKKRSLTAEEYIQQKTNPFVNFLGIIVGGILFTIVYFINEQRYLKNKTISNKRFILNQTYGKLKKEENIEISSLS